MEETNKNKLPIFDELLVEKESETQNAGIPQEEMENKLPTFDELLVERERELNDPAYWRDKKEKIEQGEDGGFANRAIKQYIMVCFWIFFICISVLLFGIWCMQREQAEKSDINGWLGEYVYGEASNEPGYPFMAMSYYIRIYESDHDYFADINIDGQTTLARIKAKVYGNREWISLVFFEYLPDHIIGGAVPNGESVLISFRNDKENIYTYWGEIEPMLYENQDSGKVYFEKAIASDAMDMS